MNLNDVYKSLEVQKNARDATDSYYMSKDDYDVCDYMITHLFEANQPSYKGFIIPKFFAIRESLKYFKKFNEENYLLLNYLLRNVQFCNDYEPYNAGICTSYHIISNDFGKKIIKPITISCYHLPKVIHDIDIISLGHEHCHALKETNYLEHRNGLVLGEVIPIFYELIDYEKNFLRKKYLLYRLFWLNNQKEMYSLLSQTTDNSSMYDFAKSYFGCYLCSFYYALVLYSMYKEEPKKVLNLVSDVLSHKITTYEMLNKLNIYCDIKGEVFEKEIENIKKVLSL